MIAIPNLKLKTILELLINVVRVDYTTKLAANLESEAWLYRCFYGVRYGNFDYYTQAKEILINRNQNNIKQLNIRNGFSLVDKPNTPTIHIHVPGEQQQGVNSIGLNLDTAEFYENSVDNQYNEKYARTFEGDYDLMITSPNYDEVELLYRFLQALFIAAGDTLNENFDGVFKFSGKQIIANPEMIPTPMFIKVWTVKIQQKISVPMLPIAEYLGNAEFSGYFVEDYGGAIGEFEL
jgi:hypothetical protein